MLRFILIRMLQAIPVLLAAVTITFFLIRLAPGGPFTQEKSLSPETVARLNAHYGLDAPTHVQYFRYLGNAVRGNLGPCISYPSRTVHDIIQDTFPISLELGLLALGFAILVGLGAGILASLRPNTWTDALPMSLAMTGICMPSFVLGPLLALIFGLWLGWFNPTGWVTAGDRVLPAITLGSAYAAYIARLVRGGMLEVLPQDFIRTARAKGLAESRVIFVHALTNAMLPVVSFLGPATAGIITGSFVVESVFDISGMGQMFVMSAFNRDYFLVLGLVAFYTLLIVVFNTLADIALALLDPRIRHGST